MNLLAWIEMVDQKARDFISNMDRKIGKTSPSTLNDSESVMISRKGKRIAGKYTPLERYLSQLPNNISDVTLSFEQIEQIIDDELPSSAHMHRAWWSNEVNGQHVNAHAWMDAGWKVDSVDQKRKIVRFCRI